MHSLDRVAFGLSVLGRIHELLSSVDLGDAAGSPSFTNAPERRHRRGDPRPRRVALARQPLWSVAVWAAQLDSQQTARRHLRGHLRAVNRALAMVADLSTVQAVLGMPEHPAGPDAFR